MTLVLLRDVAIWVVVGALWGGAHLWLIARSVEGLTGARGWRSAVLPLALRVALGAGILYLAVQAGAAALLSALAGFLVTRNIVLSRARRAGP